MEEMEEQFGPRLKFDEGTAFEWMIEGMDVLEHACRRLEAEVNAAGWDQRPHFYNLSLVGNLPSIDLEQLKAAKEPLFGGLAVSEVVLPEPCYMDPATGLLGLLDYLSEMGKDQQERIELLAILNKIVPVGFFGFGSISEGWTLPRTMPIEERKRISNERAMHIHPDRIEIRVLTMATFDGRICTLTRQRNEIPEYVEYDEKASLSGRMPDAVRLFTSLFGKFNKWRQERLDALDVNG